MLDIRTRGRRVAKLTAEDLILIFPQVDAVPIRSDREGYGSQAKSIKVDLWSER